MSKNNGVSTTNDSKFSAPRESGVERKLCGTNLFCL